MKVVEVRGADLFRKRPVDLLSTKSEALLQRPTFLR